MQHEKITVNYPGTAYPQYQKAYIQHMGTSDGMLDDIKFMMRLRNGSSVVVGNIEYVPGAALHPTRVNMTRSCL